MQGTPLAKTREPLAHAERGARYLECCGLVQYDEGPVVGTDSSFGMLRLRLAPVHCANESGEVTFVGSKLVRRFSMTRG